jgi:hypothetical protein
MAAGSRLVREREAERLRGREVKIARGRRGFGRGSRRAYDTGEERLRKREPESIGRRRGAWKETAVTGEGFWVEPPGRWAWWAVDS